MDQTKNIAAICERLREVCTPESIRLRIEVLQSNLSHPEYVRGPEFQIKQEYAATSWGKRYFDNIFLFGTEPSRRTSVYCDGRKFAHVEYPVASGEPTRQGSISIDKSDWIERRYSVVDAPEVIRLNHVGLEPLNEALPKAVVMPDGLVIGRRCDVFHFKKVGPPDRPHSLVYFLDKATAVPLKVSAYDDPDHIQGQAPNWVWEAKTLDHVSGRHFLPLSSVYRHYSRLDAGGGRLETKIDEVQAIRIVQAEFDISIPESTFWPVPQPGVSVIDTTRPLKIPLGYDTIPEIDVAMRADMLVKDAAFMTRAGAILSVTVFLIAFVVWRQSRWKRRRSLMRESAVPRLRNSGAG